MQIKGKSNIKGVKTKFGLIFFGRTNREEEKIEEKKRKRKKKNRKKKEEPRKVRNFVWICMDSS